MLDGANVVPVSVLTTNALPRPANSDDWFENVTPSSGVAFFHSSGRDANAFTMVESFGAGVGLFDFDVDGDLDLLCIGGGHISDQIELSGSPCRLFRNDGSMQFVDVTRGSGLDVDIDYSFGVTVGDIDNNRLPDLFITTYGASRLFLNSGSGRFEDATSRLHPPIHGWHTAACIADVTQDGRADLFVAGYLEWQPDPNEKCFDPRSGGRDVCMPGMFSGAQDLLYTGTSEGTLIDGSVEAGLLPDGKGLGVVAADFDGNGKLDFYVANDVVKNELYLNQGHGAFTESAVVAGVAGNEFGAPEGSMGVDVADFNLDGNPDIFVTNYEFEENSLYRNNGSGLFSHVTVPMGLAGACRPFVGFGTVFLDADMDGWQDIAVVNGHVTYRNRQSPYQQPAFLFQNINGTRFRNITETAGPWFSVPHSGRGLAVGDIDNNGSPDLVISEQDGPVTILKNLKSVPNWIGVQAVGTLSATDAVGAKITLAAPGEHAIQTIRGGGSYLSYSDPRLRFRVDDPKLLEADIEVQWPTGTVETFSGLSTKNYHIIKEGAGLVQLSDDERKRK